MRVAFWMAFSMSAYVYFVYPLLLACVRRAPRVSDRNDDELPRVSLVIAAHNEAAVIRAKIENGLAMDYPADRLKIVVASDGSTDETNEIVRSFAGRGVWLEALSPRGGKTRALNTVVPRCTDPIVVLSDANTMYRPDAVRKLVRHFADPNVGCVSGDVRLVNSAAEYAPSEGIYYRYERFIQQQESELGAIIGADGGMYAIRRELFHRVPDETVVDDFVISMNVGRAGFLVRYDAEAIALEDGTLSVGEEFRRKARVVAGAMQALLAGIGVPRWSQGRLLWCYVSHKLLRWAMPVPLVVMLITAAALWRTPLFLGLTIAQATFYGAAALHPALLRIGWNSPVTNLPYYFCMVNGAAAVGLWRGVRKQQCAAWNRTRRDAVESTLGSTAQAK